MIKIITNNGDEKNDFIFDVKNDFWSDIKKFENTKATFITQTKTEKKVVHFLYHLAKRIQIRIIRTHKSNSKVFGINMGPEFGQFIPFVVKGYSPVVYMMDAWPSYHAKIDQSIRMLGIEIIFFSSRQVAELYSRKGILKHSIWIPEAVRIEKYSFKPEGERDIDVLNFGRKWDKHHNLIVDSLQYGGYSYFYEKIKGQLVLPDRDSFLDALSRAKITICVPSNITHPDRAGDISTITMRYFQCMASKSLILGIAPTELIDLFGYNPIIEIDINNSERQIIDILENISVYKGLIDKNYEEVAKNHTWKKRWQQIQDYIEVHN